MFTNVTFGNWDRNDCGKRSLAIALAPGSTDINYPIMFTGIKWLKSAAMDARYALDGSTSGGDGLNHVALIDADGSLRDVRKPKDPFVSITLHDQTNSDQGKHQRAWRSRAGALLSTTNPFLAKSTCEMTSTKGTAISCPTFPVSLFSWRPGAVANDRSFGSMKLNRVSDGRFVHSLPRLGLCSAHS